MNDITEMIATKDVAFAEDGAITFKGHEYYQIDLKRCDTPEKILSWINHLSEKTWIDKNHIRSFISTATTSNKIAYPQSV